MASKDFINEMDLSNDLNEFSDNIKKGEELYNEVHSLFKKVNGSGAGVLGMSSTTSLAELSRSMATIRSTNIDAVNKRFMAKKTIIELKMKQDSINNGEVNLDQIQLAKSLIQEVIGSRLNQSIQTQRYTQSSDIIDERKMLDDRVSKELNSGNIRITSNEKAMKYDFNDIVDYQFDKNNKTIIPVNKNTNEIISDYPRDRIPIINVIRVEKDKALTSSGTFIKIFKG